MYEQPFPEVDDLVMIKVIKVTEMGAYVNLLEYNNIEGMILLTELSRRRVRSINKAVRVGQQDTAIVVRVDAEKGYIDLSKKRVTSEDISICQEKFNKSKTVHSILYHVARKENISLKHLYTTVAWPLSREYIHTYNAFKLAVTQPDLIKNFNLPDTTQNELISCIQHRLTPQPVKIRADLQVKCFGYDGIDAIKESLLAGADTNKENIKIRLVAPPDFIIITECLDKELGLSQVRTAIDAVIDKMKTFKGGEVTLIAEVSEIFRCFSMYPTQFEILASRRFSN